MFSGIGGFRLGLEKANQIGFKFRCVWANDIDKYACQIYRKNFGGKELIEGDIRTIDPNTIPNHELLTAGFPCQSFSIAGKRRGFEDTRGTLFYEIARIASVKRPKLLLLENVKGLLSNDEGRTFAKILQTLDDLGYLVEWQTLNSKHFGVPQNRERVFIVGHLRGTGSRQIFPIGEACAEPLRTCKKTQREGKPLRVANTLSSRYYKDGSENLIQIGANPDSIVAVETAHTKANMKEGRFSKVCHSLDDGKSKAVMIANTLDRDGYLRFGERSRDEHGKPQLLPIGYRKIRRLTPIECERLQGFPDKWTENGLTKEGSQTQISDTQRYKLLGNAVTVNVVEFLGKRLKDRVFRITDT